MCIRDSTRGATGINIAEELKALKAFQSTLPQGERLGPSGTTGRYNAISIHAPTRGATASRSETSSRSGFQSTLPQGCLLYTSKGSDKGDVSVVLPAGDFNPRSHKGSDRSWPASRRGSETNFNPRSHKGSDRYLSISVRAREFQSTLPQGERRESGSQMCLVHRDFNPRSHKGSDGTDRFIQVRRCV